MVAEKHHVGRRGITMPQWDQYDLSITDADIGHLPRQVLQLDHDTLHDLRSGMAPKTSNSANSRVRSYLNRLKDRTAKVEIVERKVPSLDELKQWIASRGSIFTPVNADSAAFKVDQNRRGVQIDW